MECRARSEELTLTFVSPEDRLAIFSPSVSCLEMKSVFAVVLT